MIFFRKKIERLVNPKETEKRLKEEPLDLEKGDLRAIIIAAFITIGPLVLLIGGIFVLVYLLFAR